MIHMCRFKMISARKARPGQARPEKGLAPKASGSLVTDSSSIAGLTSAGTCRWNWQEPAKNFWQEPARTHKKPLDISHGPFDLFLAGILLGSLRVMCSHPERGRRCIRPDTPVLNHIYNLKHRTPTPSYKPWFRNT